MPPVGAVGYFPSFSEGLSLRRMLSSCGGRRAPSFPFLFGGTFIEAEIAGINREMVEEFPFLFGGTFIEAL